MYEKLYTADLIEIRAHCYTRQLFVDRIMSNSPFAICHRIKQHHRFVLKTLRMTKKKQTKQKEIF